MLLLPKLVLQVNGTENLPKVNESRYIALFVLNRLIKKLFSIDFVNIYLFLSAFVYICLFLIFSSIAFANIYIFFLSFFK